jgi:exonuclease I
MSRKPPDTDWTESVFNDPRQLTMVFAVRPEDDFDTLHRKNPQIWRDFRKSILDHFNRGERTLSLDTILKDITGGVTLQPEIIDRYWQLFISNHQEMEHVLTRTGSPK